MAQISTRSTPPPTQIDRFLGLNEDSSGDSQLALGESSLMNNFRLTENYKLTKREGYVKQFDSLGTFNIRGLWYGKVGGLNKFLFAAAGHIYEHNTTTKVNTIVGSLTDAKTSFFSFNDKVYVINGSDYLSWNGTGTFATVAGYVPLIATATPPTGGGSDNEGLNVLTGKKRQSFSGNGTATYTLREANINSVDSVYVDGVLKTVTTHYTVNLTAGTITFTAGNIPATGVDNVEIAWTKGTGSRSEITSHKFAMYYGGQNDTRVFLYGNGTNKYVYSGLANGVPSAEYFPALNFQQVGTDQFAVTDIVRQYDRQIIFTNGMESYYSYYDTLTDATGNVIPAFPTFPLNDAIGNVAFGQAQLVQNNPFSIQNGVYQWVSTNVRDERNADYISKKVQLSMSTVDLSQALTLDWEVKKEYWLAVGQSVWIFNYQLNAWYKFTLSHTPTSFLIVNDSLYFGTTDGMIMKFDTTKRTDNGTTINAHWETGFYDFGAEWLQKYLTKVWITIQPGTRKFLNVSWQTDKTAMTDASSIDYVLFGYDDIDYAEWSYQTFYNPTPFVLKIKAKKFVFFKLLLENNDDNSEATVLSINLLSRTGGQSK